jgi:hypothetical protein
MHPTDKWYNRLAITTIIFLVLYGIELALEKYCAPDMLVPFLFKICIATEIFMGLWWTAFGDSTHTGFGGAEDLP